VEDFSARIDFNDGGEAEDGEKADDDGAGAVGGEYEARVGFAEDDVSEVLNGGERALFLVDGEGVDEGRERDPGGERVREDFPAEARDVAEEVAQGPTEWFVSVEGGGTYDGANGDQDGEDDDEVEVCCVEPFPHRGLGGGEGEVRLGD
jgi:hypothetical protein